MSLFLKLSYIRTHTHTHFSSDVKHAILLVHKFSSLTNLEISDKFIFAFISKKTVGLP